MILKKLELLVKARQSVLKFGIGLRIHSLHLPHPLSGVHHGRPYYYCCRMCECDLRYWALTGNSSSVVNTFLPPPADLGGGQAGLPDWVLRGVPVPGPGAEETLQQHHLCHHRSAVSQPAIRGILKTAISKFSMSIDKVGPLQSKNTKKPKSKTNQSKQLSAYHPPPILIPLTFLNDKWYRPCHNWNFDWLSLQCKGEMLPHPKQLKLKSLIKSLQNMQNMTLTLNHRTLMFKLNLTLNT